MKSKLDLWDGLTELRRRIADEMHPGLPALGIDLSLPQITMFTLLADVGPLTIGALAARIGRSQATTSHLVAQLELRGLVERAEDPADARRTVARLSKEGARAIGKLERLRRQSFERVLAPVPPAVRRQLEAALNATLESLDAKKEKS